MRKLRKPLVLLALFCASCTQKPRLWTVERISVDDATLVDNPSLKLTVDQAKQELQAAFDRSKRFAKPPPDAKPGDPTAWRCRLEVSFTREALDEEKDKEIKAEVGVELELKRPGEGERFQVSGLGQAAFAAAEPSAREPAFRKALQQALDSAVGGQILQLSALDKPESKLIADLSSPDARTRDFAVQALADRRSTEAVPALIERLEDDDRSVAMHAVGALGAIGDKRAVAPLIEMTQGKDPQFLISIVEVIGGIGGRDAEAFLFTLSGHPEDAVREVAQSAQERLKRRAEESASAQRRTE